MSLAKCLCCTHYKTHSGCTVSCNVLGNIQMKSSCSSFEPDEYAQCYMSSTNHCNHHNRTYPDGDVECSLHGRVSYRDRCYDFVEDYGCKEQKKKGCFLTTASCQILGKTDNCKELEALRAFRDNYLEQKHPELISEYYKISPTLVDKLLNHKNKKLIAVTLMNNYIKKCIKEIDQDKQQRAISTYKEMIEYLSNI